MNHSLASLLLTVVLIWVSTTTAFGQHVVPTSVIIPPSSVAHPGDAGVRAHTNLRYISPEAFTGKPQVSGPPFPGYLFETPASLACIYQLQPPSDGCNPNLVTLNPSGGGRAIAIVDAYDDSNAFIDLQDFSAQFGITPITPHSFRVVYAPFGGPTGACTGPFPGPQPPSAGPTGWDVEEALDIEYSHAMAPEAKLYLVEAQSDMVSDWSLVVSRCRKEAQRGAAHEGINANGYRTPLAARAFAWLKMLKLGLVAQEGGLSTRMAFPSFPEAIAPRRTLDTSTIHASRFALVTVYEVRSNYSGRI